jgi:hypothetical protein
VVTVTDDGRPLADGPVLMGQRTAPADTSQLAMPWLGFVKLPQVRPGVDAAVQFELWPDGRAFFNQGMPMFRENRPLMRYTVWEGKLLDPSLASLDTRLMESVAAGTLTTGWTVDLERGCVLDGPDTGPAVPARERLGALDGVSGASPLCRAPGEQGHDGARRARRRYPHPARLARRALHVPAKALGPGGGGTRRGIGAEGRRIRVAAQGAVRR